LIAEAGCRGIAFRYEQAAGDSGAGAVSAWSRRERIEFHREGKIAVHERKVPARENSYENDDMDQKCSDRGLGLF